MSEPTTYEPTTYERLALKFKDVFKDTRGGATFQYITGEQCTSRLNEVLGPNGWSFRVLEHGYNEQADEMWVLTELTANLDGTTVVRQQFGSQKVKRSRTTDIPLDIGFDLKGATTDAMKKCASLIGVGLYLYEKEAKIRRELDAGGDPTPSQQSPAQREPAREAVRIPPAGESYTCEQCDEELKELRFRDGTTWTPAMLASYGRRKHNKVLCMQHYREANEARKRAEQSDTRPSNEIPF